MKFSFAGSASGGHESALDNIGAFSGFTSNLIEAPFATPLLAAPSQSTFALGANPDKMAGPGGGGGWTPPYTGYYTPAGSAQMSVADQYTTDPVTVVGPPGSITATYSGNGHQVTITAAPPPADPNAHDPSKTTIIVQGKLGSVTFTHDTTVGGLGSELNAAWAGIQGAFAAIGNAITTGWNDVVSAVGGALQWLKSIFADVAHGPGANAAEVTAGSTHHSSSIGHDPFAFGAHHLG